MRCLTASLLLCAAATTAAAEPSDADRAGAVRALYGDGLAIKTSGDSISIDWGELDAATYQRYARELYRPALEQISADLNRGSLAYPAGESIATTAVGRTLIEPVLKMRLCVHLADSIGDFKASRQATFYCNEQALRQAKAPAVAFRGAPVSYSATWTFDGVALDEPIYRDGAVVITVAAPGALDHFGAWRPVPELVNKLHYEAPPALQALARDTRAWADTLSAGAAARVARRDRRFLKARGSVVFTAAPVSGWEPIEPAGKSDALTCEKAEAHIYGPKKKGTYDLTVRANGVLCANSVQSQSFVQHRGVIRLCGEQLKSGANTIEVAVSTNVTTDTGRRRVYVKKDRVEARKLYNNRAGKRIATGSITCTR